jgi:hypothetical protein
MDAVLGHGFHPLKARQRRSIPNLQTVHRHGRIPEKGQKVTSFEHRKTAGSNGTRRESPLGRSGNQSDSSREDATSILE